MTKRQIENVTFLVGFLLVMTGMFMDSDFSIVIISAGLVCIMLGSDIITSFKSRK